MMARRSSIRRTRPPTFTARSKPMALDTFGDVHEACIPGIVFRCGEMVSPARSGSPKDADAEAGGRICNERGEPACAGLGLLRAGHPEHGRLAIAWRLFLEEAPCRLVRLERANFRRS